MKKIAVGLVLALSCVLRGISEEPKGDDPRCSMKLYNGSVIKGTFKGLSSLSLKTRHGMLKFALKDIRSVSWGNVKKEELDTISATDGTYKGWIEELEPLDVDTGYGVLKIPTKDIKALSISRVGKALGCDFESEDLGDFTNFGTSTWNVTGGKLSGNPSGNYDSIQFNEVLEGSYTLEVDVTNANNGGILWNATDGQNANALWMNSGSVRVFGNGTWYNNQLASWGVSYPWNSTVHVKIEVDGGKAVVYANDKKLGEVNGSATQGRVGFFNFNGGASFDNLVITR